MGENVIKNDEYKCSVIHESAVQNARAYDLEQNLALGLADFFKIFADPTRIRILNALFLTEMCVCDIASALDMSQSAISHQLRTLRQARLVKSRRLGKIVYYSLDDDHIKQVFDQGLNHVKEGYS